MNRFKELFERVLSEIDTLEHKLSEQEFGIRLFEYENDKYELIEYLQFLDFENFKEELYRHISNKYIVSDDTAPIYSSLKELEEYCNNAENATGGNITTRKADLLRYFRIYLNFRQHRNNFDIDLYYLINPLSYEAERTDIVTGEQWFEYAQKHQELSNKVKLMEKGIKQVKDKIAFLLEGQTCSVVKAPTYLKPERVMDIFHYYLKLVKGEQGSKEYL